MREIEKLRHRGGGDWGSPLGPFERGFNRALDAVQELLAGAIVIRKVDGEWLNESHPAVQAGVDALASVTALDDWDENGLLVHTTDVLIVLDSVFDALAAEEGDDS